MIQEYQLRVLPEVAANEQRLKEYLIHEKGLNAREITATRILKRSIDARQRTIYINLNVRAYLNEMPKEDEYQHTLYNNVEGKPQVVVVGAGPGGLFAALRLIELGLRPVIVERGKDVRERKKDLAQISRQQLVNPESNYSFGEGGAGAYSDGKLYTRSKKRGNVDKILNVFCQHGASTSILVDAHPHIGTDKLPRVIENMRNTIIQCGGEVHFETRMDALLIEKDEVKGIETNTGKTFLGPVILATGHSARDVYRWLAANTTGVMRYLPMAYAVVAVIIVALVLLCVSPLVQNLARWLLGFLPKTEKWQQRRADWLEQLEVLGTESRRLLADKPRCLKIFALQALKLFGLFCLPYLCIRFMGLSPLGFWQVQLLTSLMLFVSNALPNVAGMGSIETAFLLVFGSFLEQGEVMSVLMLYRIASYYVVFAASAVGFFIAQRHLAQMELPKEG